MKKKLVTMKSGLSKSVAARPLKWAYKNILPVTARDSIARNISNPYSELEEKHGVIFVHIPKNGGNGVAQSLFGEKPKGHNLIEQYKKYDHEKFQNYFKFSFSRNVWARFYSAYSYLLKGGFGVYDEEFAFKYIRGYDSFNDFVAALDSNERLANKILGWTHFLPQKKFITINGKIQLDYLGSLESSRDCIEEVANLIGLPSPDFNIVNSSGNGDYRKSFSSKSVDVVASLYSEDIKLLNQSFE